MRGGGREGGREGEGDGEGSGRKGDQGEGEIKRGEEGGELLCLSGRDITLDFLVAVQNFPQVSLQQKNKKHI